MDTYEKNKLTNGRKKLPNDNKELSNENEDDYIGAYIGYIISFVLIILFVLAVVWEWRDYRRLEKRPPLSEIEEENKTKELYFYSCFMANNRVSWRHIYIASFLSSLLIWALLYMFGVETLNTIKFTSIDIRRRSIPYSFVLLVFASIFVITYIVEQFRSFHLYRPMCSKVKEDNEIF